MTRIPLTRGQQTQKFDNKPWMKKGQNKNWGTTNADNLAIHWGLPAHDSSPQFFCLTGATQINMMFSI
jgi:hypothetical protein